MKKWLVLSILGVILLGAYAFFRVVMRDPLSGLYGLKPANVEDRIIASSDEEGAEARTFTFLGKSAYDSLDELKRNLTPRAGWRLRSSDDNYAMYTQSDMTGVEDVSWYLTDDITGRAIVHEYTKLRGMKYRIKKWLGKVPSNPHVSVPPTPTHVTVSMRPSADVDLSVSFEKDDVAAAESAIKRGAVVNPKPTYYDMSPLQWAMEAKAFKVGQLLISRGADVNWADPDGMTLLDKSAWIGSPEVVKFLHSHGGKFGTANNSGLLNVSKTRTPVDYVAEPMFPDFMDGGWINDDAWKHSADVAQAMIECGANVNAKDNVGRTPLFYAALAGNARLMRVLLDHKPKLIDYKDAYGYTPLRIAERRHRNQWKKVLAMLNDAIQLKAAAK